MSIAAIRAVLETVMDPEIPVISVVDLGIVRGIEEDRVIITPTYSGCPATDVIERSIREALDASGFRDIAIETRLDPPWTTDWISEAGKASLHAYGIAPPDLASSVRRRTRPLSARSRWSSVSRAACGSSAAIRSRSAL